MANILSDDATWLAGRLAEFAGTEVVYRRGDQVFDITIVRERTNDARDRNWLLADKELSAVGIQWIAKQEDLLLGEVGIRPEPGDEIEWEDDYGEPRVAVVFPLYAEHCFRFTDPDQKIVRIFTVDSASFADVRFRVPSNTPSKVFTLPALLSRIAGRQFTTDLQTTVKVSQTNAYFDRRKLEQKGVTSIPNWAKLTVYGREWVVNMEESEWGAARVKLALEVEELERDYQARRAGTE